MSAESLLGLFVHFLSLALFATGGAIALASDMHRYVVDQHGYITHTDFVNSIALAQASPGPNLLYVTVMGWYIAGLPGALVTTLGLTLPAFVIPLVISKLSRTPQFARLIQAMQRGLSPVALGLMGASCFLLVSQSPGGWKGPAIIVVTIGLLSATRLPPVALIVSAGVFGAFIPW
jgi:chromate transporter